MIGLQFLKAIVVRLRLKRRFPTSVIHVGSTADSASVLGAYTVLFRNVALIDTNVGDYSYIQSGTSINNAEVGKFCAVASGVSIGLAAHPTFMVSTSPVFYDNKQPLPKFFTDKQLFTQTLPRTSIAADVWIGQGVLIKAGITIGVGAVIGAGAVVTRDVAPYSIAAGNPCRHIRFRFSEDTCKKLLETRWWELDETKLQEVVPLFHDPELLLKHFDNQYNGITGQS
jgi:acetyltransferase-like isoleucine patch superfamily enzyme